MGKSAPSPPPIPNPYDTARAQTGSNVQTAIANSIIGNANEISPYGTVNYRQIGTTRIGGPGQGPGQGPAGTGGPMAPGAGGTGFGQNGGAGGATGAPGGDYYDIPQFERTVSLSPEQQHLYDQQTQLGGQLNDLALGQTSRLQGVLSQPFNPSGLPDRSSLGGGPQFSNAPGGPQFSQMTGGGPIQTSVGPNDFSQDRQRVEDALFARMNPQLERDRAGLENNLINQGFQRGTEAFTNAMDEYNRSANDARLGVIGQGGNEQSRLFNMALQGGQFANTAQQQGFDQNAQVTGYNNDQLQQAYQNAFTGTQYNNDVAQRGFDNSERAATFNNTNRQQALQEALALRNQPINEISALMSGGQVTPPQFAQYQGGQVAGTPIGEYIYQGANLANQQYGQQMAQSNAALGGLFGLGQSGIYGLARYGLPMLPSDRRLKRDIRDLGIRLMNGLKLYAYRYAWEAKQRIGVMADEVRAVVPHAVVNIGGYDAVQYGEVV